MPQSTYGFLVERLGTIGLAYRQPVPVPSLRSRESSGSHTPLALTRRVAVETLMRNFPTRSLFVSTVVFGTLLLVGHAAMAQLVEKKALTLAAARRMVAAAEAAADRKHLRGVIAVCDDGGWPILVERMDNSAYTASVELAPAKARSAALFKKPSGALEDAINHGRIAAVTARDFVEMQGGLPVVVDGQVIGGIGASFDTPDHDIEIAQAGLAALTQ